MDPFSLLVVVAENVFLETSMTINKVLKVLRFMEHVGYSDCLAAQES